MKTIYIVFYNNKMVFAFETRDQAEYYIRIACQKDSKAGYTRENLYYRSVDMFLDI